MAKNIGKVFEEDIKSSCTGDIFYNRIKDIYIPPDLIGRIKRPKNKYDNFIYSYPILIPCELKSTGQKSFSFDEKIIKEHQIKALLKDAHIKGVYPGFIFNFRSVSETYFVHIKDFVDYKETTDRKSLPLQFCRDNGIKIEQKLKVTRWKYDVKKFIEKLIGQST